MEPLLHIAKICLAITVLQISADPQQAGPIGPGARACSNCHVAEAPTPDSAQLKTCARTEAAGAPTQSSSEAPDVFLLDQLTEIYVPVVFPHKLHAAMTEMGGGCIVCHHRNPPGPILACRECHGEPSNPVNLGQPGLKGAYHRQCLGCHREWTHDTECVVCHAKREPGMVFQAPADSTDIMGMLHPNIEVPDIKVYRTEELEDTPIVTFHHKEHVELFGRRCVDCHRQESCTRCHDIRNRQPHVRDDPHEDCVGCHRESVDDDCAFCHAEIERGGFNHLRRTAFDLIPLHQGVGCRQCHAHEQRFAGLDSNCGSCHGKDWQPDAFDHGVTGVPLDELHADFDCVDCHIQGLGKAATCDTCHDEPPQPFLPVNP